nr:putative ribonuclease H-like domain-containing protein [Tanacetum cinerariifolium]
MTGNRSYLTDYEKINGDLLPLKVISKERKLVRKGKIRTGKLDFEDVYFVKELKFNLFNVSQMCDKKNSVLFTDIACVVLSSDFKLIDESHVLLKVPRKNNMYSVDLKNVVPQGGRKPALIFMRLFGCPVTIFNTIDHLGKFDGKADERFFVGYSTNSKAFKVFNSRTRIVEENLHVKFSENTPNIAGSGPNWLFDIDALTKSINYKLVVAKNQSNGSAGTKACDIVGKSKVKTVPDKDYILLPLWTQDPLFFSSSKDSPGAGYKPSIEEEKKNAEDLGNEDDVAPSTKEPRVNSVNSTNRVNVRILAYLKSNKDVFGAKADLNNLESTFQVSPILITIIHKDHPLQQVIEYLNSAPQTRRMSKNLETHGLVSTVNQRTNYKDFQKKLFSCFLSLMEPKKVMQALKYPCWIEAMQEELLKFKLQEVWTLVDLQYDKRAIGSKWVYRNKLDERGIVIRNKARLVAQRHTQEEGIDYDEVFPPVARIEAIRLFLAYASFKDIVVYQMDVKSAFNYEKIEEEVYICQPPGFEDPDFLNKVYKVEKALYGLHQAPRAWYETLLTYLLYNRFQRGMKDMTLFIKKDKSDILLVQVYVDDIIFGSTMKEMCTDFEKMMHKKFQNEIYERAYIFLRTANPDISFQQVVLEPGEKL